MSDTNSLSFAREQYKMEDDIDIEEHDLLNDPALRSVFPDLAIVKSEFDISEECPTKTEVPIRIENKPDSTVEVNSGNPLVCSTQDLDVKPDILCTDIDNTRAAVINNLSESEKVNTQIKNESENVTSNKLPFYRNSSILGKINVDAPDDKLNNDAPSDSNNVVNNEGKTLNEPDIVIPLDSDEDGSRKITKPYYELEKCLLVKLILTDCYTSLLGNKCYCAQCTVLFPTTEAYSEHYMSTHTETTQIKNESENITLNESPFFRNRIILGKINVDASDEECNNDAPNFVNNEEKTYNESDIAIPLDSGEDRSRRITKQYYEMEKCLLVKLILTDCYTSLLSNKCYCAQCTVLFPTTEAYSEHYMSTHTETTNSTKALSGLLTQKIVINNSDSKIECDICKKRFTKKYLIKHKVLHTGEKPFECEICKKRFALRTRLVRHKLIHTEEKPFECDTCKKTFTLKGQLNSHKLVHTGAKPYECEVCQRKFAHYITRNRHKLIHTGEKPFECVTCKKRFARRSTLVQHKLIHTGEKPFECDTCKKTFTQKESLNSHKLIHTGAKPYECEICKRTFAHYRSRYRHKVIHSCVKPFEC